MDGTNIPAMVEPVVVPCVFVSGVSVIATDGIIRAIGWTEMPSIGGEIAERRIVVRFVLTRDAARLLRDDLSKALKRRGH